MSVKLMFTYFFYLPTKSSSYPLSKIVLYVWARAKEGRSDAFFFKKSLLGKKKGARYSIKLIELY